MILLISIYTILVGLLRSKSRDLKNLKICRLNDKNGCKSIFKRQ